MLLAALLGACEGDGEEGGDGAAEEATEEECCCGASAGGCCCCCCARMKGDGGTIPTVEVGPELVDMYVVCGDPSVDSQRLPSKVASTHTHTRARARPFSLGLPSSYAPETRRSCPCTTIPSRPMTAAAASWGEASTTTTSPGCRNTSSCKDEGGWGTSNQPGHSSRPPATSGGARAQTRTQPPPTPFLLPSS
jgi:hypothetical protein